MKQGFVYFIASETLGAIKIGFTTKNPLSRVKDLQTGCPAPLKLISYFPGTMQEEGLLHEAFLPLHIHGEWFRAEGKLQDFMYYLDSAEHASRQDFHNALHDVLLTGLWYPFGDQSEDQYNATGDATPLRHMIEAEGLL